MITHDKQQRAAAADPAPPRPCTDHTADYAQRLAALAASTAVHFIRNSRGAMRMVTKLGTGYYLVSGREAYGAWEAAMMVEEGEV